MKIDRTSITIGVFAALFWTSVALIAATHQWAELRGSPKDLSWLQAFRWQGLSWLLLIPLTPALFVWVRRRPLGRRDRRGIGVHVAASVGFGLVFLFASVPLRLAVHPSPARWSFFGEALYKSIPGFTLLGIGLYWLLVLLASLIETRGRLYARATAATATATDPPAAQGRQPGDLIAFATRSGTTRLRPAEIRWAEPAPAGATIHADRGDLLVRHTLSQLELILPGGTFVRTHRGALVNADRIRSLIGSPSRDGTAELDSGERVRVSRRRHQALASRLRETATTARRAPLTGEDGPLTTTTDTAAT